jgi:hypothetical protein
LPQGEPLQGAIGAINCAAIVLCAVAAAVALKLARPPPQSVTRRIVLTGAWTASVLLGLRGASGLAHGVIEGGEWFDHGPDALVIGFEALFSSCSAESCVASRLATMCVTVRHEASPEHPDPQQCRPQRQQCATTLCASWSASCASATGSGCFSNVRVIRIVRVSRRNRLRRCRHATRGEWRRSVWRRFAAAAPGTSRPSGSAAGPPSVEQGARPAAEPLPGRPRDSVGTREKQRSHGRKLHVGHTSG